MMRNGVIIVIALLAAISLALPARAAQRVGVEVTNLTNGIYFTPLLITAHGKHTDLFEPGQAASEILRLMAECGDISVLLADIVGDDTDTVADPSAGLLPPGGSASTVLDITATAHCFVSVVGMLLPTNDGFVGLDSVPIPSRPGRYAVYVYGYDAGTETNDELLETGGCAPGMPGIPADPTGFAGTGGSGVAGPHHAATVHMHRGNIGDMDSSDGPSDLDSTVHRWLNPVAKIIISVKP